MDYWKECIEEAFEDAKISATNEQIDTVTTWIESAHDGYGMAFGHDCIPDPVALENKELKKALANERDKIHCTYCNGGGRITENGPCGRSSNSECCKCRGEGKITP